MTVLNPDLFWEEEKEPPVPLVQAEGERTHAPETAPSAQAEPFATRLQRTVGNAALAREAEGARLPRAMPVAPVAPAGTPALAARRRAAEPAAVTRQAAPAAVTRQPAPAAPDRHRTPVPRPHPTSTPESVVPTAPAHAPLPAAAAHREEAALEAAARRPAPSGTTPETEAESRAVALAAALVRTLAAFATDPEAADLLGLARLAEGAPSALAQAAAQALARAVMRADVEHRAAIARRLALDLRPHPDLRLARLLAGLIGAAAPSPEAPAPAPPPAPPTP